jgi:hypothetical protein
LIGGEADNQASERKIKAWLAGSQMEFHGYSFDELLLVARIIRKPKMELA